MSKCYYTSAAGDVDRLVRSGHELETASTAPATLLAAVLNRYLPDKLPRTAYRCTRAEVGIGGGRGIAGVAAERLTRSKISDRTVLSDGNDARVEAAGPAV